MNKNILTALVALCLMGCGQPKQAATPSHGSETAGVNLEPQEETTLVETVREVLASRVDGSSEEAMATSIEIMTRDMSKEETEQFGKAVMAISMDGVNLFNMPSSEILKVQMRKNIDGLTAVEILKKAEEIIAARRAAAEIEAEKIKAGRLTVALEKRDELEEKKRNAAIAKEGMRKVVVLNSEFTRKQDSYSIRYGIVLRIRNDTPHALSRIYMSGVLKSPDRSIPWIDDTFNFSPEGGIEPGETRDFSLSAPYDWRGTSAPEGTPLTVSVYRIDGPDGEALLEADFDKRDREKLEKVRATIVDLSAEGQPNR